MRSGASILVCGLLGLAASVSSARGADDGPGGPYRQTSSDAVELDALAPPANRSTELQTYGDAAIARAHFQRHHGKFGYPKPIAGAPLGIVPCDPVEARAAGYVCKVDLPKPGYGEFYAFTPSYVTAPQVPRNVPAIDQAILPPATAFFLSANDFLFGRAN